MEAQEQVLKSNSVSKSVVSFLSDIIAIPRLSKEEENIANYIENYLKESKVHVERIKNNIIAKNYHFDNSKSSILLNSHHDTIKPNNGYTYPPFKATFENGKLIGLGSNDAGASLSCLILVFLKYYHLKNLKYNLVFVASAEEEISGANGIERVIPYLPKIDFAIVGEPTNMQMAIAQKGLMVVDCIAKGKSGHSARNEGINAINIAIKDIQWINSMPFEKESELLGNTKATVTTINTSNKAHNVIPGECSFTIDIRMNEKYSMDEIENLLKENLQSEINIRSKRLKPSFIDSNHPIVKAGTELALSTFGSPTLSDSALMPFPALKIGPGDSARSHTADEYILINELEEGYDTYINLLNQII